MTRLQSDTPDPGQDVASKIIKLASKLYEKGNALLIVRRVPGHQGVMGNGVTDTFAKKVATGEAPDGCGREAMGGVSASCVKRRAVEMTTKQWRGHISEPNKVKRTFNLQKPNSKPKARGTLRTTLKAVASRFYQLLSGHAKIAPSPKTNGSGPTPTNAGGAAKENKLGITSSRNALLGMRGSTLCGGKSETCWKEVAGQGQGQESRWFFQEQEGLRLDVRKAKVGPSNASIRDLLRNELFTEAVLDFLQATRVGTAKEGIFDSG